MADLSALPVMNRGLKLQMRKLDFAAIWPAPLMHADMWGTTELRIEGVWSHKAPGLVICGVVRRKNTAAKFGDPADMAQRLQDQHERLAAPRRAPGDADVGCALQNRGLRSGLCRDRRGRGSRHWLTHRASPRSVAGWRKRVMIVVGRNIDGLLGLPRSSFPPGELDLAGQSRRSVRCLLSPSFPGKVFCCASFSTCVSSGSRLLSGRISTAFACDPVAGRARVRGNRPRSIVRTRLAAGARGPPTNDQAKKSGAVTPRDTLVMHCLQGKGSTVLALSRTLCAGSADAAAFAATSLTAAARGALPGGRSGRRDGRFRSNKGMGGGCSCAGGVANLVAGVE